MSEELPVVQRRRTARPKTPEDLSQAYPISIVVPFRNAAVHLPQVLEALSANDLRNTEIWLIDDASDDSGADLVAGHDFAVEQHLLRLPRRVGPAEARNRGMAEARHPYLFFLDADIVLPPQALFWIRESLDIYRHRPEVKGVLGVYSPNLPTQDFFTNYKNLYIRYLYDTTRTASPFVHTPIFCVCKETLAEVGGFDGRLDTAEDFRLGVALGSRGYRFVIDRRIQGVHLKTYTAGSILREDRRRVADLRRVELARDERRFYYQAHRPGRLLSVILPNVILACLAVSIWFPVLWSAALMLWSLFFVFNFRFFNFCRRKRGWLFAVGTIGFFTLEMTWAGWVSLEALLRYNRLSGASGE